MKLIMSDRPVNLEIGENKDISATMPLSKWLFKMAARSYWINYGKKFGVSEKEMQRFEIES